SKGVDCRGMAGNRIAIFSNWVGKSKLRRFAALLVFWIIFDQLFGYVSPWHSRLAARIVDSLDVLRSVDGPMVRCFFDWSLATTNRQLTTGFTPSGQ
ncbi:MAG: hypothetical protein ACLP00_01520, partial [Terracidiphilus sp.]